MKPPEEALQRLVSEWLKKADADLTAAEFLLSETAAHPGIIAFHCQQAAEKYLKAFLTRHGLPFPKTHDLERLLRLLRPVEGALADELSDVIVLTLYAVEARYPGDQPDVTRDEAHAACDLARLVRDAVLARLDTH